MNVNMTVIFGKTEKLLNQTPNETPKQLANRIEFVLEQIKSDKIIVWSVPNGTNVVNIMTKLNDESIYGFYDGVFLFWDCKKLKQVKHSEVIKPKQRKRKPFICFVQEDGNWYKYEFKNIYTKAW